MTRQLSHNTDTAYETPEVIVALWQRAINGDSTARDILLQRLTSQAPHPFEGNLTCQDTDEEHIVVWQQSLNGNPIARMGLIQRIMPEDWIATTVNS